MLIVPKAALQQQEVFRYKMDSGALFTSEKQICAMSSKLILLSSWHQSRT